MKHARALRLLLEADVEPDRRVERGELVDEDRLQLGLEGLGLLLGREVAALAAPAAGRVDDPADHLPHGALALGRGHAAAEVLLRDDVRRGLRPELGELDALLVERRLVLAGDERVAELPLDLVERVAAGDREVPADGEAGVLVDDGVHELVGLDLDLAFCALRYAFLLHRRHLLSSFRGPSRDRAASSRSRRTGAAETAAASGFSVGSDRETLQRAAASRGPSCRTAPATGVVGRRRRRRRAGASAARASRRRRRRRAGSRARRGSGAAAGTSSGCPG